MAIPSHNGRFSAYIAAVDVVLFTIQGGTLKVLLVKRHQPPYRGAWALPGGMVGEEESVDKAALRELQEKTNVDHIYLEQLYTFGEPHRDPRGRVITVAYYALVNWQQFRLTARHRAAEANWFAVKRLPALAFDHARIVEYALERLRSKINYTTVGFQLLPRQFTLTELQRSYEVILGQGLDKRNFRRKMLQLGILKGTRDFTATGRQRPARLYTFAEPKVVKLQEKGIIVPF
ncbi:MAG: NUDIX domain-containing protein [Candidatus Omnitrophota bacterium]|nr:NUDIX domain-containing protein [Candidatus Omnitrophota bacterium]